MAFVKNEGEILDSPCWIMLINVVAMDMLKSKMPPGMMMPIGPAAGNSGKMAPPGTGIRRGRD